MNAQELVGIVGSFIGVVLALGTIAGWILKASDRMTRLEERIGVVWSAWCDNAKLNAVKNGWGTVNSPLVLHPKARDLFETTLYDPEKGVTWRTALLDWYLAKPSVPTDEELALQIQQLFRPKLIASICIPNGMADGECVLLAAAYLKEHTGEHKVLPVPKLTAVIPPEG